MPKSPRIPYPFILEHLTAADVVIKPMFGGFAVYSDAKLCLFLVGREFPVLPRAKGVEQNGVYIATTRKNVPSLTSDFGGGKIQYLKGEKVWIFVAESSRNFEEYTVKACEMIAARDGRIGR